MFTKVYLYNYLKYLPDKENSPDTLFFGKAGCNRVCCNKKASELQSLASPALLIDRRLTVQFIKFTLKISRTNPMVMADGL